jgi:hypothetical protein
MILKHVHKVEVEIRPSPDQVIRNKQVWNGNVLIVDDIDGISKIFPDHVFND